MQENKQHSITISFCLDGQILQTYYTVSKKVTLNIVHIFADY